MQTNEIEDVFHTMLCDIYDAENQLTKALPKMADSASDPALAEGFRMHLRETENQIVRLDKIHEMLDMKIKDVTCKPIKEMIAEGETMFNGCKEGPVRDAALIAAAQKVEHYEIATYGSLIALAQSLGHDPKAIELLREILEEEKSCDASLSFAACDHINQDAARHAA